MRSIRRSRAAVGLLAAASLVAASGCGADQPERLVSSPATQTTEAISTPETTSSPEATTPSTAATDTLESSPAVDSAAVLVSPPFEATVEDADFVPVQWLEPWDGGYLAVGVRYPPQALPDRLPPEIADLFPPEVTALFPDGLPPTQREAMDILSDAGLLDVVMDILDEHSEAMDAVQSAPLPEPELVASWTADGDAWTPTDLGEPGGIGDVSHVTVTDNRLTIAATALPDDERGPSVVTIASTTDLENWATASFEITPPEGAPETALTWATVIALAADDDHWVARTMADVSIDSIDAVPPPQPRLDLWSGSWDGEPTTSIADQPFGMLVATDQGFLDLGDRIASSPDGQTWTETAAPTPNRRFLAAAPLGDGVVAITGNGYVASKILMLDATGTTTAEVEIPGLNGSFTNWNSPSTPAFLVSTESGTNAQPDLWLLATADGDAWLVADIDELDAEGFMVPQLAATNGATVLVGNVGWEPDTNVWQRFTLTQ